MVAAADSALVRLPLWLCWESSRFSRVRQCTIGTLAVGIVRPTNHRGDPVLPAVLVAFHSEMRAGTML
jgi:hypothetical protein